LVVGSSKGASSSSRQRQTPFANASKGCRAERSTAARKWSRAALGLGPISRLVDGAEGLLKSPRLGDQRVGGEEVAETPAPALGQPLATTEEQVAGAVELGTPGGAFAASAHALGTAASRCSLAPSAHRVKRGVGAADQVEAVGDDPRPREDRLDRLPVGLVRVDRDDLDRVLVRLGQRAQVAFDPAGERPSRTSITRCRSSSETTVASSCERRWWASSSERRRGAWADLVASRRFLTGDLGVGTAAAHPLPEATSETP
jgi:hypothetical protein